MNVALLSEAERRKAASFVRDVRMAHGLTQQELAQKLGISGSYVSLLERADHTVGSATVRKAVAWARENRSAA